MPRSPVVVAVGIAVWCALAMTASTVSAQPLSLKEVFRRVTASVVVIRTDVDRSGTWR